MRSKWTDEKVKRWEKEGRGHGDGHAYTPWLNVNDFSSRGRVHRIWSDKFERTLELFSDVEKAAFLMAERSPSVIQAYEQYPLSRDLSRAVANRLGIRHPTYPGTTVHAVMTVDLFVTVRRPTGEEKVGIDSKTKQDAQKPRTLQKLQLMQSCLAHLGHRHVVLLDSQVPKQFVHNLEWIRSARIHERERLPYDEYFEEATRRLYPQLLSFQGSSEPLRLICRRFDERFGYRSGTGLRAARLLLDAHELEVDLHLSDLANLPMRAYGFARASTPAAVRSVA